MEQLQRTRLLCYVHCQRLGVGCMVTKGHGPMPCTLGRTPRAVEVSG